MELIFERKDGLSCVEFLYKAIAQYYSRDYELAFIDAWSFSYNNSTGFPDSNEGNREENFRKYHGIQVRTIRVEGRAEIFDKVRRILDEKKMCIMYTDLYYIPWFVECYKKQHCEHAVLITDISKDGYFCYDFFSTKGEILPFDHVPKRIGLSIIECVTPEIKLGDIDECKAMIAKSIKKGIAESRAFEQMELFAESLNESFDLHKLISDIEMFKNSRFMDSVNRIAQCRFQFSAVLAYLGERYQTLNLSGIENMLKKSAVCWKSITALLIKSYLLPDNARIINKISHKVREVKALEEQAYNKLQKVLSDNSLTKMPQSKALPSYLQDTLWQFVDIEDYVNHKAFGDAKNTQHARYEEASFILLDQNMESIVLSHDSVCFKLGNLRESKYDNIECSDQVIEIKAECSELALLANAEYDHQVDYLEVLGKNSKHVVEISTSAWHCTPVLGDMVMWSGMAAIQNGENIEIEAGEKRLFGKIYHIPKMYVDKIVLPCNPNFHIFAISIR